MLHRPQVQPAEDERQRERERGEPARHHPAGLVGEGEPQEASVRPGEGDAGGERDERDRRVDRHLRRRRRPVERGQRVRVAEQGHERDQGDGEDADFRRSPAAPRPRVGGQQADRGEHERDGGGRREPARVRDAGRAALLVDEQQLVDAEIPAEDVLAEHGHADDAGQHGERQAGGPAPAAVVAAAEQEQRRGRREQADRGRPLHPHGAGDQRAQRGDVEDPAPDEDDRRDGDDRSAARSDGAVERRAAALGGFSLRRRHSPRHRSGASPTSVGA